MRTDSVRTHHTQHKEEPRLSTLWAARHTRTACERHALPHAISLRRTSTTRPHWRRTTTRVRTKAQAQPASRSIAQTPQVRGTSTMRGAAPAPHGVPTPLASSTRTRARVCLPHVCACAKTAARHRMPHCGGVAARSDTTCGTHTIVPRHRHGRSMAGHWPNHPPLAAL